MYYKLTGVTAALDVKDDKIEQEEKENGSDDDSGNPSPN